MIEGIVIGMCVASLCATGAMFLKLIETKKESADHKKLADNLLAQQAELQKQLDAAQLENAQLKTQRPKSAAVSVRMRRPDRGFGAL